MRGTEGRQSGWVHEFATALEKHTGLPIKLWDERLTSVEAGRVLRSSGISIEKRAAAVDRLVGRHPAAELPGLRYEIPARDWSAAARWRSLPADWPFYRVTRPLPGLPAPVYVDFPRGTSTQGIAAELAKAGVIGSRWDFWLARMVDRGRVLQAGEYAFNHPASPLEVFEPHRARRYFLLRAGGSRGQEHVRYRRCGGAARPLPGGRLSERRAGPAIDPRSRPASAHARRATSSPAPTGWATRPRRRTVPPHDRPVSRGVA